MANPTLPDRIANLYSADAQVRANATDGLPEWSNVAEARQWARFMLEDHDYAVREAAARALGEVGVELDVKLLRELSEVDDIDVAVQAITSVRRILHRVERQDAAA